jgi:hypothetical protein
VPIQLVQVLRHHRTMIPVPATYLAATLLGAVVGVAAQLLLGWPWWLAAAAVVAAVWLFFTSTVVWGDGGSGQPLATDLLRVVRPARPWNVSTGRRSSGSGPPLPPVWPAGRLDGVAPPRRLGG